MPEDNSKATRVEFSHTRNISSPAANPAPNSDQ
jgi:hypothetical protein